MQSRPKDCPSCRLVQPARGPKDKSSKDMIVVYHNPNNIHKMGKIMCFLPAHSLCKFLKVFVVVVVVVFFTVGVYKVTIVPFYR